ncbi:hypothetical protein GCM10023195_02440 [Actinoallomurus liliacearum]|uniref:FAD-binding PCMH-type domain-containing protein n=1 Tax=Actinoallomurus liliacearum TaxID=1080073 RepID=A0ABP8TCS8_9ACTN
MRVLPAGLVAPTQRTIPDFRLHRPRTIAEAVLAGSADGAVYAQGCTDLFARFREGLDCSSLVWLADLEELTRIDWDGTALAIGAAVGHHTGSGDSAVRAALPGLAAGWRRIANHRIRLRATIGGNLMARRTRYEMSIMLDALGAELLFAAPDGGRTLAPADLWDRREPHGALLHTIRIPEVPGTWFGYERSLRPLLTVAAAVRGDTVRMSVGSEYTRPYAVEAPVGAAPADIAALLPEEIGDAAGSARYRRHAAGVLLGRLLARFTAGEEHVG